MYLTHVARRDARLLSILRQELGMSSGLIKRLKYAGAYSVNGVAVHTDFPVKIGDFVRVCLDEPAPVYPAEEGALDIVYEDEFLIALDKPAGMLVHPSSARNTGTLANRLTAYYQKTGQASAVHPVSRLDRDTFGLVLLAKNAHVHAKMNTLSKAGSLEKTYHALVFGCPPEQEGLLDAPIARKEPPSLLRCIRSDGKPSRTAYRVLEVRNEGCEPEVTKLQLRPLTGRTHQLRIHCAHFGFPILGDPQYGTEASQSWSLSRGLTHQQLCAVSLSFPHPMTAASVTLHSHMDVGL